MGGATLTKNVGLTPAFILEAEIDSTIRYTRFYNTYLPGYIISLVTFIALIFIFISGSGSEEGRQSC
jgi:hypothetical protein